MTLSNDFAAYIDDLKATHGENLVSVVFYGSATKSENPVKGDVRLLVAMREIGPDDLRRAHSCTREWTKLGYSAPVYFTERELSTASDVFPIEFNHMMRARRVLFGRDVLEGVSVTNANLRHQVEFELRSKLLRLRRDFIAASASSKDLNRLMAGSLPSLVATLRACVLLTCGESPVDRRDVLRLGSEKLGLDNAPFEKILSIRENPSQSAGTEAEAEELFAAYLGEIEKAIRAVDSL